MSMSREVIDVFVPKAIASTDTPNSARISTNVCITESPSAWPKPSVKINQVGFGDQRRFLSFHSVARPGTVWASKKNHDGITPIVKLKNHIFFTSYHKELRPRLP